MCQIEAIDSDENSDLIYRITTCKCYDENNNLIEDEKCNTWFDIETKNEVRYNVKQNVFIKALLFKQQYEK